MPKNADSLLSTFEECIGDQPFVAVDDLIKIGVFGSYGGLYYAIDQGQIPVIKISSRRLIARRQDIIEFFNRKLKEQ